MFNFFKKENIKRINIKELDEVIGKVDIIDIREFDEVAEGTVATAVNIPMGHLLDNPEKYLRKDKTYYLLCRSGARSENTTIRLQGLGYDVVNIDGGIMNYQGKNLERKI